MNCDGFSSNLPHRDINKGGGGASERCDFNWIVYLYMLFDILWSQQIGYCQIIKKKKNIDQILFVTVKWDIR